MASTREARVLAAPLRDIGTSGEVLSPSGVEELDRVLGGGFTPGSTTLLFGEPGVGKSTLALMALRERALRGETVLLVAAEESMGQVASRALRLGDVPSKTPRVRDDQRHRRRGHDQVDSAGVVRRRLDRRHE